MKTSFLSRPLLAVLAVSSLFLASQNLSVLAQVPADSSVAPAELPSPESAGEHNKTLPDYKKLHDLITQKKSPLTWLITGDSITHGCMHTKGGRNYFEHFNELIRWDMGRKNDVMINTGISGDRMPGILKDWNFRVARFEPQIISLNMGMNDCGAGQANLARYKADLKTFVKKARDLKAVVILQVPSIALPADKNRQTTLPMYSKAIREVAQEDKVLLVDHPAHFYHYKKTAQDLKTWMNDNIHPNDKGQIEMFKKMTQDLGLFNKKYPTCRLGDTSL